MAKGFLIALLAALTLQEGRLANSYLGKAPPELGPGTWINAPAALTLQALRGKVVWLEFGYLKCPPCRKMKPVLARWHKDFAAKGLVVIDVSDGSLDGLEELQKEAEAKGETFPILWDKDGRTCTAYGIQGYPQAWLIGADGAVLWEGLPVGHLEEIEKAMAAEFAKAKK